jgi:hypothetical protein
VSENKDFGAMHSSRKRQWDSGTSGQKGEKEKEEIASSKKRKAEEREKSRANEEKEREKKWEERERGRERVRREESRREERKRDDERREVRKRDDAARKQQERVMEKMLSSMREMVEVSKGKEKKREHEVNAFTTDLRDQLKEGRRERDELRDDLRSEKSRSRTMGGTGSRRTSANPPREEKYPTSKSVNEDGTRRVCRLWDKNGKCTRTNCTFAHEGQIEACRQYLTTAGCNRVGCWFRHGEKEGPGKSKDSENSRKSDRDRNSRTAQEKP